MRTERFTYGYGPRIHPDAFIHHVAVVAYGHSLPDYGYRLFGLGRAATFELANGAAGPFRPDEAALRLVIREYHPRETLRVEDFLRIGGPFSHDGAETQVFLLTRRITPHRDPGSDAFKGPAVKELGPLSFLPASRPGLSLLSRRALEMGHGPQYLYEHTH